MSTSRKPSAAVKKSAASRPAAKSKATPAVSKSAAPAAKTPAKASVQTIGLEEIKSLIALVGREPFQEFEFEAGDMRFRIRKDGPAPVIQAPVAAPIVMAAPVPQVHHPIPRSRRARSCASSRP